MLYFFENTAIPYRASTGPEQVIPCVVFPHREKPFFISWDPCNENRFFPVGNTTQGKPCSQYSNGFAVRVPRATRGFLVLFMGEKFALWVRAVSKTAEKNPTSSMDDPIASKDK